MRLEERAAGAVARVEVDHEADRIQLKVLLVGPLPPPMMGPAVGTTIMRDALELAGATVLHVNTQDRRSVVANVGVLDARNVGLGLAHGAQTFWLAWRHDVDLIYVPISQGRWGYARDALLIMIGRALRKPVVVHLRGSNLQSFYRSSTRLERSIIRRTLSWVELAIALTPRLRSVYDGLVAPDRVRVLENAITDPWPGGVEPILQERRRRATEDPFAPHLLYVANDFAAKGFRAMIAALADPGLERARLTMVGAPPPEVAAEARRLAAALGVGERVELAGELLDASKLRMYELADIFAYPTENDGQPLVVIEAMASGLPIVTTTYGGIPDTVGDSALLVEPRDVAGLASALRQLIEDPELRADLGRRARGRFVEHYTPEQFQHRLGDVFRGVAASAGTRA